MPAAPQSQSIWMLVVGAVGGYIFARASTDSAAHSQSRARGGSTVVWQPAANSFLSEKFRGSASTVGDELANWPQPGESVVPRMKPRSVKGGARGTGDRLIIVNTMVRASEVHAFSWSD
jgi:hypothetical protein